MWSDLALFSDSVQVKIPILEDGLSAASTGDDFSSDLGVDSDRDFYETFGMIKSVNTFCSYIYRTGI